VEKLMLALFEGGDWVIFTKLSTSTAGKSQCVWLAFDFLKSKK